MKIQFNQFARIGQNVKGWYVSYLLGTDKPCTRCAGEGSSVAWSHTGRTCYKCEGTGRQAAQVRYFSTREQAEQTAQTRYTKALATLPECYEITLCAFNGGESTDAIVIAGENGQPDIFWTGYQWNVLEAGHLNASLDALDAEDEAAQTDATAPLAALPVLAELDACEHGFPWFVRAPETTLVCKYTGLTYNQYAAATLLAQEWAAIGSQAH